MISIKYKSLRTTALALLAIPSLLFFLGWLKLYIGIPFALILLGALGYCARQQDDRSISIKVSTLIAIVAVVILWCILSGQGGFFVQKPDHYYRNPIFRDIINYKWPVRYPTGNDESLVYYIGYWLLPALFGKLGVLIGGAEVGWLAGRIALLLWSVVLITIAFLLVCFYVGASRKRFIYTALLVFIFFSGMDAIGCWYDPISYTSHIEWWASYFQYSSMSTQLCWVFNQAVPAWIATALMLNEKDKSAFALIGFSILPCSPLPIVGLAIFMLCIALKDFAAAVREKQLPSFFREIFSYPNIAAVITILPTFALYYMNNSASGMESSAEVIQADAGAVPFLVPLTAVAFIRYFMFILAEFVLLVLFIKDKKNSFYISVLTCSLLIIPIFRIGMAFDFCMRASIPALFVLMTLLIKFFISCRLEKEGCTDKKAKDYKRLKTKFVIVALIFAIGCITPIVEYNASVTRFVNKGIEAVKQNDELESLSVLSIDQKINFVGENSSDSLFYKTIGRS